VLDMRRVSHVDITGDDAIRALLEDCRRDDIALVIARASHGVREFMRRDGLLDDIGVDRVAPRVTDAVALAAPPAPGGR
jgi:MFS superfamily sulfate permease-like transporter